MERDDFLKYIIPRFMGITGSQNMESELFLADAHDFYSRKNMDIMEDSIVESLAEGFAIGYVSSHYRSKKGVKA